MKIKRLVHSMPHPEDRKLGRRMLAEIARLESSLRTTPYRGEVRLRINLIKVDIACIWQTRQFTNALRRDCFCR